LFPFLLSRKRTACLQYQKLACWAPQSILNLSQIDDSFAHMAEDDRRNPLQWEGGYWNSTPAWPREPDLAVIRLLAHRHLAEHVQMALKDAALTLSFFAGGTLNKLYLVSHAGLNTSYIFRVSLPVCPYFTTESKAATLVHLRVNTSMPVPRVFAWDSSPDNEPGFEWILMEKIAGVPLVDVWRNIEWERKLVLIESLAGLVNSSVTTNSTASEACTSNLC